MIESLAPPIAATLTGAALADNVKEKIDQIGIDIKARFSKKLQNEVESNYKRNSSIKLLSNRSENVDLLSIYVHNSVRHIHSQIRLSDKELLNKVIAGERVIVRGTGGAGKTLMMKYFWLQVFCRNDHLLPIFVDLKRSNTFSDPGGIDISTMMRYALTSGNDISYELFKSLCKKKKIFVIFDGFDEVNSDRRHIVEQQIIDFSVNFKSTPIVMTSRDNDSLERMSGFKVYDTCKFNLKQARSLVERAKLDPTVSKKLLQRLDSEFFEKYETFLEIPLLILMFSIVFRNNANVPDETHQIYEKVFSALYDEHDSHKEGFYKRERSLGQLALKRFLACFCIRTYFNEEYDFETKMDILERIQDTKDFIHGKEDINLEIDASPGEILRDLTESLCFLYRDGEKFHFVHRSFQEYFSAYYIMNIDDSRCQMLLSDFLKRKGDSVPTFCYELNSSKVWDSFIGPVIDDFPVLNNISPPSSFTKAKQLKIIDDMSISAIRTFSPTKNLSDTEADTKYRFEGFNLSIDTNSFEISMLQWLTSIGEIDIANGRIFSEGILYRMEDVSKISKRNFNSLKREFSDRSITIIRLAWGRNDGFLIKGYRSIRDKKTHRVQVIDDFSNDTINALKAVGISYFQTHIDFRTNSIKQLQSTRAAILKSRKKSMKEVFG